MADVSAQEHVFAVRVYYEDTDAGGIVYHANYLRFAERARTELLRDLGFDHMTLHRDQGLTFAVRGCSAEFLRPAHLDDLLEVRTRPTDISGASLWLDQTVFREDEPLVEMKLRLVCIRDDGRPARLPSEIRTAFIPDRMPADDAGGEPPTRH